MNPRLIPFYMNVAQQAAQLSRAQRAQVGCIIVKNNNIISFSWNGMPSGWDNCCEDKHYDLSRDFNGDYFPDSENQYPYNDEHGRYELKTKPEVLHAEANALSKMARSSESCEGATLFCTHSPCMDCAKLIYQSGITTVYYKHKYLSSKPGGLEFLEKCNINLIHYDDQG